MSQFSARRRLNAHPCSTPNPCSPFRLHRWCMPSDTDVVAPMPLRLRATIQYLAPHLHIPARCWRYQSTLGCCLYLHVFPETIPVPAPPSGGSTTRTGIEWVEGAAIAVVPLIMPGNCSAAFAGSHDSISNPTHAPNLRLYI